MQKINLKGEKFYLQAIFIEVAVNKVKRMETRIWHIVRSIYLYNFSGRRMRT